MENNSSAKQPCLSDQEMLILLHAREDIFRLAQETHRYFSAPIPPQQLPARVKSYMANLKASAEAVIYERQLSDDHEEFPVAVCTGADADWLWFSDRVSKVFRFPVDQAVRVIQDACSDLLLQCRPGTPCDPELAADVLRDLQARFGFLTDIFSPNGCLSVIFPGFCASHDGISLDFGQNYFDGPECRFMMLASPSSSAPNDMVRVLYILAAANIIEFRDMDDLSEEELGLLESTVEPNIRTMGLNDQVNTFVWALAMGLSYGGKHIDFDLFPRCGTADRLAWRGYAAEAIRKIGEKE